MTIFILVSILLVATLAIALLMGVSPTSQKVKVRTMYVGAALMLVVALVVCDYIDALPDFPSKFRFNAVLVLTVTVGYLCIAIACMEKYNVLKRKNRVLEETLTEKEQEKISILMERQSEQQQALQKGELEWFAGKIKMFSEEGRTRFDSSALNHNPAKRDVQSARTHVLRLLRFLQHGQETQRHCKFLMSGL